jgi:uncharacterized SAM-binding protein YcdF (DUF218 family)
MKRRTGFFRRLIRILLPAGGVTFLLLIVLAFTTLPFHAYYRLATKGSRMSEKPATIVMLAGAGIPSENGLIRAWYTAWLAKESPEAKVIVAAPGKLNDSTGDPLSIAGELILRGVKGENILHETEGKNTRGQARNIAAMIPTSERNRPLAIVTSPEHIRRAVLSFRKAGFTNVSGFPAFESSLEADLVFDDRDLKGNRLAPPIGENLQFRYQFWNHLKYEVIVLREYFALAYYKLRGWI